MCYSCIILTFLVWQRWILCEFCLCLLHSMSFYRDETLLASCPSMAIIMTVSLASYMLRPLHTSTTRTHHDTKTKSTTLPHSQCIPLLKKNFRSDRFFRRIYALWDKLPRRSFANPYSLESLNDWLFLWFIDKFWTSSFYFLFDIEYIINTVLRTTVLFLIHVLEF